MAGYLREAGVLEDRVNQFLGWVKEMNKNIKTCSAFQDGFTHADGEQITYDDVTLVNDYNKDGTSITDMNCRLTSYLLFGQFMSTEVLLKDYDPYLMFDVEAIESEDRFASFRDYKDKFITIFEPVKVQKDSSLEEHIKEIQKEWKDRGIKIQGQGNMSLITLYLHDTFDELRFVGHTGVMIEQEDELIFLISLITGSINDIEKTGLDYPETLLEKIKRKIILFDGDQTRFIYNEPKEKKIRIQGLAGTGKTELLLHKIKELYINNDEVKIAFTCHNEILAENLRTRIPEFFNFMKVTEQIKWNEKLWVMRSWGSKRDENSGVYSYICNYYSIPFERSFYSANFDTVCKNALDCLNGIDNFEECFDYILIDESQDFSENFFNLCEKVTKKCVYIAGDIFQNVFENVELSKVEPQFLLNKCYRTDPKTLMSAHGISMGLFESGHMLRWLEDREWNDCGYDIKKNNGYYDLYRKPLRRFEDLSDVNINSLIIKPSQRTLYYDNIMQIIDDIREKNDTVEPDDIGIIFLENENANYDIVNQLKSGVKEKYGWDVNIGYETKEKRKDALFISNRNNVKGLEFPFIIAFMQEKLTDDLQDRNSIYMILTRSFITTYFILPNDDSERLEQVTSGVNMVNEKGFLHVKEPSEEEKKKRHNAIIQRTNMLKSQKEVVDEIFEAIGVKRERREALRKIIQIMAKDETDRDKLYEMIRTNNSYMN